MIRWAVAVAIAWLGWALAMRLAWRPWTDPFAGEWADFDAPRVVG